MNKILILAKTILTGLLCLLTSVDVSFSAISLSNISSSDKLAVFSGFDSDLDSNISERAALRYAVIKISGILDLHGPLLDTENIRAFLKDHTGHLGPDISLCDSVYFESRTYCVPFSGNDGRQKLLRLFCFSDRPQAARNAKFLEGSSNVMFSVEDADDYAPESPFNDSEEILPEEEKSPEDVIKSRIDTLGAKIEGNLPVRIMFNDEIAGLVDPADIERIEKAITAGREDLLDPASGLPNLKLIDDISGSMEYPFVRNALIHLREPITIKGRVFRSAKLKYVLVPRGQVEEVGTIENQPSRVLTNEGDRAVCKEVTSYAIGGGSLLDVYREARISDEIFNSGNLFFSANPHLALGYFEGKTYSNGRQMGFSVSLIENDIRWKDHIVTISEKWEQDMEGAIEEAESMLSADPEADVAEKIFPMFLKRLLLSYGELIADQHRLGYSHGQQNTSNISGTIYEPVMIDLTDAVKLNEIRENDRIIFLLNDLVMAMGTVMNEVFISTCVENGYPLPAEQLLKGYFSEMENNGILFEDMFPRRGADLVMSSVSGTLDLLKKVVTEGEDIDIFMARQDILYKKFVETVRMANHHLFNDDIGSLNDPVVTAAEAEENSRPLQDMSKEATVSGRQRMSDKLDGVSEDMSVYEILRMLDMHEAQILREKDTGIDMLSVYEVVLPSPEDPKNRPWTDQDVFNLRQGTYDVLIGPRGVPIAIFHNQSGKYLDLTDFGFQVPDVLSSSSKAEWKDFNSRSALEKHLLDYYLETSLDKERYVSYGATGPPYCYIEVDTSGHIKKIPFYPYSYDPERWGIDINKPHAILPQFPTVYPSTSTSFSDSDESYYRKILKEGEFNIGKEDSVLLLGPGTGVDTWMVSLFTDEPIHVIGINPFEIANVKATARAAGFRVNARVHNNIADRDGEPAFGKVFDKVLWNMPCISERSFFEIEGYWSIWDGDVGGGTAEHFIKHLPRFLKEEGEALLWNSGGDEREKFIKELLEEQGFEVTSERVMDPAQKFKMKYSVYLAKMRQAKKKKTYTGQKSDPRHPRTYVRDGIIVEMKGVSPSGKSEQVILEVAEMSDMDEKTMEEAVLSLLDWYTLEEAVHRELIYDTMEDLANIVKGREREHGYMNVRTYFALSRQEVSGRDKIGVEGIITVDDLGDGNPIINCIEIRPRNRQWSETGNDEEAQVRFRGVGRQMIFHAVNRELDIMKRGGSLSFSIPGAGDTLEREGLRNEKKYKRDDLKKYIKERDRKNIQALEKAAREGSESASEILAMAGVLEDAYRESGLYGKRENGAREFVSALVRAIDAVKRGEKIIVAVDTSWIPQEQRAVIQQLLNGLVKNFGIKGTDAVSIVRGDGVKLLDEIEEQIKISRKKNWDIKMENVIIIGHDQVFLNNEKEFAGYRDAGAFFGEIVINSGELGTTDLKLLEKIARALNASRTKSERNIRFIVVPDAEMMPIEDLDEIYSARLRFIKSM